MSDPNVLRLLLPLLCCAPASRLESSDWISDAPFEDVLDDDELRSPINCWIADDNVEPLLEDRPEAPVAVNSWLSLSEASSDCRALAASLLETVLVTAVVVELEPAAGAAAATGVPLAAVAGRA